MASKKVIDYTKLHEHECEIALTYLEMDGEGIKESNL